MSDSVSKYFDDLEDKEHWAKIAKEQEQKKSKFNLFGWISNMISSIAKS